MNKSGFLFLLLINTSLISVCQNGEKTYDIGYTSMVYRDYSRDNNSLKKELLLRDSINGCRIITTSMWYPSNVTESDKKVKFGDFLPTIELNEKKDYHADDSIIKPADKFADYKRFTNFKFDYTYNSDRDPNRFYYRSDHYNFALLMIND